MCSAVLHLRGEQMAVQPAVDASDNVLCWNGEVFGMADATSENEVDEGILMRGSDTVYLSEKLHVAGKALECVAGPQSSPHDPVVEVLRRVRGPFAVAWLHAPSKRLYFAHDRFGRRSLLYNCNVDIVDQLVKSDKDAIDCPPNDLRKFVLASVGVSDDGQQYQELPASGIFVLDLHAPTIKLEFHPYAPLQPIPLTAISQAVDGFGNNLPHVLGEERDNVGTLQSTATVLMIALSNAVGVRVRSIPPRLGSAARVAVLFSGGLDSVVLAALAHFHVPPAEPVDLLTVCFDESSNFASPDRLAAELAHSELCDLFPERPWRLVRINVPRAELARQQSEVQALMAPCETHMDFNIGAAFWFLSRGLGDPKVTHSAQKTTLEELNAFLQPRRSDLRTLEADVAALELFECGNTLLCPVHRCGRKRKPGCVLGICKSCCLKTQRVVDKLIPYIKASGDQDSREMQNYYTKLLEMGIPSPEHLNSFLDLLWSRKQGDTTAAFTAREGPFLCCRVHRLKKEKEKPSSPKSTTPTHSKEVIPTYQTTARVVLVGIGADEQLAGYGRHRTALLNGGEAALRAELQKDLNRIWKRNLGRDDRCIAAHGREARFPYLDENVVSTVAAFPVSSLCDADEPRGVGDKRALRLVAKALGLHSCTGLAKRAIQFGSRIAKVSTTTSNRQTQGGNKFTSVE